MVNVGIEMRTKIGGQMGRMLSPPWLRLFGFFLALLFRTHEIKATIKWQGSIGSFARFRVNGGGIETFYGQALEFIKSECGTREGGIGEVVPSGGISLRLKFVLRNGQLVAVMAVVNVKPAINEGIIVVGGICRIRRGLGGEGGAIWY